MTDELDAHRQAVARGLAAYDDLHAAHQAIAVRADSFERSAAIANAENERLRREIKQVRAQRDHFMRAYAALKAQLATYTHFARSGADMLDEAMRMAEVQAYAPAGRSAPRDTDPVPAFLTRPNGDAE